MLQHAEGTGHRLFLFSVLPYIIVKPGAIDKVVQGQHTSRKLKDI